MVVSSQPMDTDIAGDASHQRQDAPPAQQPRQRLSQTGPMTEDEQRERRASIREIMQDQTLTPLERRRSIQGLMDGRRRSSNAASSVGRGSAANNMSMMAAAAAAAADFYDSSEDDDDDDDDDDVASDDGSLMDDEPDSGHRSSNNNGNTSRNGSGGVADDDDLDSSFNFGGTSRRSSAGSAGSGGNRSRRNSGSVPSADNGFMSGRKKGRSASLRGFAAGAAAAAAAAAAAFSEDPEDVLATAQRMERSRPKCEHYHRNCTIISPCCGLAFGCRICHDECPVLPPPVLQQHEASVAAAAAAAATCTPIPGASGGGEGDHDMMNSNTSGWKQMDAKPKMEKRNSLPSDFTEEETHHNIDRFAIKEVICRNCFTRQSSKTDNCIACKIQFGEYHCNICNLWMSQDEEPYHCEDCGFCRVGGRDNFRHCHDCGMCIDALLFDDHNCKAGKYMSNCPVCQEDLFSSRSASHEMPCGHAIHWHCFRELTSFDTRCPVCKKTAETHEQMAPTWSAMAMGIALQPVPPEMARVVSIVCNDCEVRDENRRWHFLGVQCNECGSFNTTVERTTLMGREAAVFLGDDVTAAAAAAGGGGSGGAGGSPTSGDAGGGAEMEPSAAAVASVESNARSEALNNVMAAMEESASSLASLGIDDDMEDFRRSTIQAQLVHAIGGDEAPADSMDEEDVPQGQETSSGSSSSAY